MKILRKKKKKLRWNFTWGEMLVGAGDEAPLIVSAQILIV